jgi:hypothetical protein
MTEQLTIDGRIVYVRRDRYGVAAVAESVEALNSVLRTIPTDDKRTAPD